mmetsp:Transcript_6/g.14  ORF Transcript_6/g.14 Transcript_6/m.14 type:complete len:267 (-) Transcript_6:9-809(-)
MPASHGILEVVPVRRALVSYPLGELRVLLARARGVAVVPRGVLRPGNVEVAVLVPVRHRGGVHRLPLLRGGIEVLGGRVRGQVQPALQSPDPRRLPRQFLLLEELLLPLLVPGGRAGGRRRARCVEGGYDPLEVPFGLGEVVESLVLDVVVEGDGDGPPSLLLLLDAVRTVDRRVVLAARSRGDWGGGRILRRGPRSRELHEAPDVLPLQEDGGSDRGDVGAAIGIEEPVGRARGVADPYGVVARRRGSRIGGDREAGRGGRGGRG